MKTKKHKFPYKWKLSTANFPKNKGKVFSCFSCGGGSSMGYKLAGFDVIGCCEIDQRMMDVYVANHNPRFPYCEAIQDFKLRRDLPQELYNLDILDGSPPCSSFSISGLRDKIWGKKHKFREGQKEQVLDELFFHFIDLAKELQPKVIVAENVKGMLMTSARPYVAKVMEEFDKAGYYVARRLLNAKDMGVPQKRERIFFLCLRKDLAAPFLSREGLFADLVLNIDMEFNEPQIKFSAIQTDGCDRPLSPSYRSAWEHRKQGDIDLADSIGNPNKFFNCKFIYSNLVANTLTANDTCVLFDLPRHRNRDEAIACSSWPSDYDFKSQDPIYVCGMSVPPVMMAQIASRINEQWLDKINNQ